MTKKRKQSLSTQRYWNRQKTSLAIAEDIIQRNQKQRKYEQRRSH